MIFKMTGIFLWISNKVAENFKWTKFKSNFYPNIVERIGWLFDSINLSSKLKEIKTFHEKNLNVRIFK